MNIQNLKSISNSYPGSLYRHHWMKNRYIIFIGNQIAMTRYFCLNNPISYKSVAWLFNHVALPTAIDDKNDQWTAQSVQNVFEKYLELLEIKEQDIIRVYPNLNELGIP